MLRWTLTILLVVLPTSLSWYLRMRVAAYRRTDLDRPLGPFEELRPDKYTIDAYPHLVRYWLALIVTFICYVLVVGVLHP